jgi:ppGpp synthetase/RelA/SpoT-type nucleotidyltranferase
MSWAVPEYPRNQVDRAGKILAAKDAIFAGDESCSFTIDDLMQAYQIVNNSRASHSFPLNNFQTNLRVKVKNIQDDVLVVQRIKRLESIEAKLCRGQTQTMQLSQMQDIGGCRAIVRSMINVEKLLQSYRKARFNHRLRGEKDYITTPKLDGYRGIHLIYQYSSLANQVSSYDNLRIEIQLRSKLQHIWATAVEAVGIFTKQALKSNQGSGDWLRFFALMSSIIAHMENKVSVPGTPTDYDSLRQEISGLAARLDAVRIMNAHRATLNWAGSQKKKLAGYLLARYVSADNKVYLKDYGPAYSQTANASYTEAEKMKKPGDNIVLVKVDSIKNLTRAYPNLFLDTKSFTSLVSVIINSQFLPSASAVQSS